MGYQNQNQNQIPVAPNTIPHYQPPMRFQSQAQHQQFPAYNGNNNNNGRYMHGNDNGYMGADLNVQNGYFNQRMPQNQNQCIIIFIEKSFN